jgi:hypothetical protein
MTLRDYFAGQAGLNNLETLFRKWLHLGPNEQPHYANGMRPFSTGDLKHYVALLEQIRTTPAPSQPITVEMVNRARIAWRDIVEASEGTVDMSVLMRAALDAAFVAPSQPTEITDEYNMANWDVEFGDGAGVIAIDPTTLGRKFNDC